MTPIWAWARCELRRNRRAAIALVLLIGISGGVALTAAAGARRTGSAFERFVAAANAADAQLQYVSTDPEVDEEVLARLRSEPEVEQASPLFVVIAFAADRESAYDLGFYSGSEAELFDTIDGLRIVEGRRADPEDAHQVTVNRFVQRALDVEVGDSVQIGTFTPAQMDEDGEPQGEPAGPLIDLDVVGIHVTPYDLADPESPSIFGTAAFQHRYWGSVAGYGPIVEIALRDDADGAAVVERAVGDLDLEEVDVSSVSEQTDRVSDGTSVLAIGLAAFALAAALAATVAATQALHRRIGEGAPDLAVLRGLGLTRPQRALALALTATPVVLGGVLVAGALSIAASPLMPIGLARQAEPDRGVDLDPLALGLGTVVMLFVLVAATIGSSVLLVRHAGVASQPGERSARGRWLRSPLSPSGQLGVSMAFDPGQGARALPVRSSLIGAAFGVAGVVGALTFGAGLDVFVEEPASSGWNWTFAPDATDADVQAMVDASDVEDVGRLYVSQIDAEGTGLTAVSVRAEKGTPSLTVVSGRMPTGPREVALGPTTADRFGVGIGDSVQVSDPAGGDESLVVVGEVLFPTVDDNPFNEGLALPPATHESLATSSGFSQGIVTFADGVSEAEAARRMDEIAPGSMSIYALPSPPPDVANLAAVRFLPPILGAFLSLLALAAVGHALTTSARRRRHDLGIVRSLGFVGRDLRRAVGVQSVALVVAGLAVGVPLGLAIGRTAWQAVASGIGVPATAGKVSSELLAVVAGGILASAILAILPGRAAARRRAIDSLRVE